MALVFQANLSANRVELLNNAETVVIRFIIVMVGQLDNIFGVVITKQETGPASTEDFGIIANRIIDEVRIRDTIEVGIDRLCIAVGLAVDALRSSTGVVRLTDRKRSVQAAVVQCGD